MLVNPNNSNALAVRFIFISLDSALAVLAWPFWNTSISLP